MECDVGMRPRVQAVTHTAVYYEIPQRRLTNLVSRTNRGMARSARGGAANSSLLEAVNFREDFVVPFGDKPERNLSVE